MLRFLTFAVLAYIVFKIVRLFLTRRTGGRGDDRPAPPEFPPDHSYRNIEDADFEDLDGDSGKPRP